MFWANPINQEKGDDEVPPPAPRDQLPAIPPISCPTSMLLIKSAENVDGSAPMPTTALGLPGRDLPPSPSRLPVTTSVGPSSSSVFGHQDADLDVALRGPGIRAHLVRELGQLVGLLGLQTGDDHFELHGQVDALLPRRHQRDPRAD